MSRCRVALLSFALVASACSNSDDPAALSLFDDVVSTSVTTPQAETLPNQTSTSTAPVLSPTENEAATAEVDGSTTSSSVSTTPQGNEANAPAGGSGASADVMNLYVGALGYYALDQALATSPVAMPTVEAGFSPLTGLPSDRSATGAIVVKIDNAPRARPQAGLDLADVVIEQEVEGGITRFAAVFQSSAPERIGPVRSARSTDISFLSALGQPGLVYSGANEVFDTLLVRQERVRNYSASRFGGYWRDNSRNAPSNLYTSMSQFSTQANPPPAWFHFGDASAATGTATTRFVSRFPSTDVTWTWNGVAWERIQDGSAHTNEDGAVLEAANVVVAQVAVVNSGLKDPTGAVVPEFVWAGEGPVAVFTNGRRIDGRWIRPTLADPAVLVDGTGAVINVAPGSTWIQLMRTLP